MNLYELVSSETDWIAANNEAEALDWYRREYGLSESELADVVVKQVADTDSVTVETDEVDAETEESITQTATEVMAKMKRPGLVCSTVY